MHETEINLFQNYFNKKINNFSIPYAYRFVMCHIYLGLIVLLN